MVCAYGVITFFYWPIKSNQFEGIKIRRTRSIKRMVFAIKRFLFMFYLWNWFEIDRHGGGWFIGDEKANKNREEGLNSIKKLNHVKRWVDLMSHVKKSIQEKHTYTIFSYL